MASRVFSGRLDDSRGFVNPETAQTGLTFHFHHLEDEIIVMKSFPFLLTHEHEHITLAEEILFNSFCWDEMSGLDVLDEEPGQPVHSGK